MKTGRKTAALCPKSDYFGQQCILSKASEGSMGCFAQNAGGLGHALADHFIAVDAL
jgi:hypothetical protein